MNARVAVIGGTIDSLYVGRTKFSDETNSMEIRSKIGRVRELKIVKELEY